MPTYEDVLTLAQQLNAVEQARLAEALMLIHQPAQTENHLEPSSQTLILNSLKARLQAIPPGVSLVDELIAERREAAIKEAQA
jgi:hypothetical protein